MAHFWEIQKKKEEQQKLIKCYFFTKNRRFLYVEVLPITEEGNQVFHYPVDSKNLYNIDIRACQFFTDDKKPIFFYIEGIPNPLMFDLGTKAMTKFLAAKRSDPYSLVFDESGKNVIDVSFSSIGLEAYKNDNFLRKLQGTMTPEFMKLFYIVAGLAGLSGVVLMVDLIFRR